MFTKSNTSLLFIVFKNLSPLISDNVKVGKFMFTPLHRCVALPNQGVFSSLIS